MAGGSPLRKGLAPFSTAATMGRIVSTASVRRVQSRLRLGYHQRMGLERWNTNRNKYELYHNDREHGVDCERFPFESIPARIFLDTNVINRLVKWRDQVFERCPIPPDTQGTLTNDIEALMHIFYVGRRACWDLMASPKTLEELADTPEPVMRGELLTYGIEVVGRRPYSDELSFALDFPRRLVETSFVAALPDRADRELIGHAIGLGCDVFCTCDRATILSKRNRLPHLPLRILTPAEWWAHIKPWAGLWC